MHTILQKRLDITSGCPQPIAGQVLQRIDRLLIHPLVDSKEDLPTVVSARLFRYDDALAQEPTVGMDPMDAQWTSLARCLRDQVVGAEAPHPDHSDAEHARALPLKVQERFFQSGTLVTSGYFDGDTTEAATLDIFVSECLFHLGAFVACCRGICDVIAEGEENIERLDGFATAIREYWYDHLRSHASLKVLRGDENAEYAQRHSPKKIVAANQEVISYLAPHWTSLCTSLAAEVIGLPLGARFELAVLYYAAVQASPLTGDLKEQYLEGAWHLVQDCWFCAEQEAPEYDWVQCRVRIYRAMFNERPPIAEDAEYWLSFACCLTPQFLSQSSSKFIDQRICRAWSLQYPEYVPVECVSDVHLLSGLSSRALADRLIATSLLAHFVPFWGHLVELAERQRQQEKNKQNPLDKRNPGISPWKQSMRAQILQKERASRWVDENLPRLAMIGANKIARGATTLADFSEAMLDNDMIAERLRPHLLRIYQASLDYYNDEFVPKFDLPRIER